MQRTSLLSLNTVQLLLEVHCTFILLLTALHLTFPFHLCTVHLSLFCGTMDAKRKIPSTENLELPEVPFFLFKLTCIPDTPTVQKNAI